MKSSLFLALPALTNAASYCWKTLAPLPQARQEHATAAIGPDVYAVSGLFANNITDSVAVYHTTTNTWSSAPPLPEAMHHANVATVAGKLYVLGGISHSTGWTSTGKSYRFDPATQKWEALADMPDARGAGVVGVIDNVVYIAGGLSTKNPVDPKMHSGREMQPMVKLTAYHTDTNTWTIYPDLDLPEGRDHAGGAIIDGVFYVVAGRRASPDNNRNTVLAWDLKDRSAGWVERAAMPTTRGGVAGGVVGKKIYIFGGEGNAKVQTGVFPDVDVYDAPSNKWSSEAAMKSPRHGLGAAAVVGETLYLVGGGKTMGIADPVTTNESYGPC
ncbi:galactose oxidase [Microthyrium microscopicum]|uniref:Galactose oxidase n=1 Tax=Microthyrium microscopicum TaxID=703497 RepID=A0A6A6UMH0_9PEZI|nr:galactose oxidase [Microthyrium microscopicum]